MLNDGRNKSFQSLVFVLTQLHPLERHSPQLNTVTVTLTMARPLSTVTVTLAMAHPLNTVTVTLAMARRASVTRFQDKQGFCLSWSSEWLYSTGFLIKTQ